MHPHKRVAPVDAAKKNAHRFGPVRATINQTARGAFGDEVFFA
jgi:hypothetical protein